MTDKDRVIDDVKQSIKTQFENDSSGHDWFHIERVWKLAKQIALKEKANVFIVELGALLHDIADHKFVDDFETESIKRTESILKSFDLDNDTIKQVKHIVLNCSFKGGIEESKMKSIEGKIVQDADKLDAIGAIGIARTFAFGGKFGSLLYHPNIKPIQHKSLESYQKNRTHTINHFYEKLLLLKDLMHTQSAKQIALQRHQFMEDFLTQFFNEWNGVLE
ncbi:MAG TPA: HD domain-containing protein [Crocinitomix sp.]|nr:HD domain-containing protein [Crocinitomix sp.]